MPKRIFISAGHGGTAPGVVANGRKEGTVVTEFRDLVAHYLEKAGAVYSRDGSKGSNLPLRDAAAMIRADDVAVEFHLNGAVSDAATGVETLSAPKHKAFGAKLCAVIAHRLQIRNRGAKDEGSGQHATLGFVRAGGVIVELFFLTNPNDLAAYDAVKWLLAREVAEVLIAEAAK